MGGVLIVGEASWLHTEGWEKIQGRISAKGYKDEARIGEASIWVVV